MMFRVAALSLVSIAAAEKCDTVEAWSGQRQITVPACKGTGCNANGHDWNCAWCVFDLDKCMQAYGKICSDTASSREAEGTSCAAKPMKNIVEVAEGTAALSTLVSAVVAADLVDTLVSPGPFTVFAPTNDAFAALPAGTLDSLMKPENKDTLVDILTYHVVAAAAYSKDLVNGQKITTVEGKDVTVHIKHGGVKINNANVVIPDVMASNGVVHVVDAVLAFPALMSIAAAEKTFKCDTVEAWSGQRQITVPACKGTGCNANGHDWNCAWCVFDLDKCMQAYGKICSDTASSREAEGTSCAAKPMKNIVEVAEGTAALSTLVSAVVAADLVDTLVSPGPFTVFAPTNDAFAALPAGTLDSLMKPENKDTLVDILTYHVVAAAAYSKDLVNGQKITTVEGKDVTVHIKHGGVKINNANVVIPDVMASNGVVHVVDAVLAFPAQYLV